MMKVIALELNEQKNLDRLLTKMQVIMTELAELDRIMKAAEQAKRRYIELQQELAKICKEYAAMYGEE